MKKTKTVLAEIPEVMEPPMTGEVIDMSHSQFIDWAGGHIAVALFKGDMRGALIRVLAAANVRSRLFYHKQLVEGTKNDTSKKTRD
jgi:hypothetical protein